MEGLACMDTPQLLCTAWQVVALCVQLCMLSFVTL